MSLTYKFLRISWDEKKYESSTQWEVIDESERNKVIGHVVLVHKSNSFRKNNFFAHINGESKGFKYRFQALDYIRDNREPKVRNLISYLSSLDPELSITIDNYESLNMNEWFVKG